MTKIEDSELRRKPIAELESGPSVDASQIGVAVWAAVHRLGVRRMGSPRSKSC